MFFPRLKIPTMSIFMNNPKVTFQSIAELSKNLFSTTKFPILKFLFNSL